MSRQKIPLHLKKAIWYAYDRKSGYEGIPISFTEMEIDHIIPERVFYRPKEPNEFEKWKEKYNLSNDFNIQGIENFCPSTREFNLRKSDNGLYDESGAFDRHIVRGLTKAAELKSTIEDLQNKFKKELDKRQTKKIIDILNLIEKEEIDLELLVTEGLHVNYEDIKELENKGLYNEILAKYQKKGPEYYNFGEYFEIMTALRYAVSYKREEATFWIDMFNNFLSNVYDIQVKKRVFYERTYAMFKCEMSWEPIEVEIIEYFKAMNEERNLEILRQAAILYGIFFGEFQRGRIKSSEETISEVRQNLIEILQTNIDNAITDFRKVNLEYSKLFIEATYTIDEYKLLNVDDGTSLRNLLNRYFNLLNKLILSLETISYFDFDELYNTFIGFSERFELLKEHPDYDEKFKKISNLKNKYEGINTTVPDLMKRAIEIFNQKNYLKAIKQFHEIKNISFNPKHLYTCIYSIFYIASCYEKLGLLYAAKYYYLIVYHMAIETDSEYNTKQLAYALGIDNIATNCFDIGNFNETIYLTALSLILRDNLSLTPYDYSTAHNSRVILLLNYILYTLLYEKKKSNTRFGFIQRILEIFDLWGLIAKPLNKWEHEITEEELLEFERVNGLPFKFFEEERIFSWNQLGVSWTIKWANAYINNTLSEEFIAYLQIHLSALNKIDIIPCGDIIFKIIPSDKFNFNSDNEEILIELPTDYDSSYFPHLLAFSITLLSYNMIISKDQILKEIKPIFEKGYFSNHYHEIFNKLLPEDLYSLLNQGFGD